jgi:hypothetical protein
MDVHGREFEGSPYTVQERKARVLGRECGGAEAQANARKLRAAASAAGAGMV